MAKFETFSHFCNEIVEVANGFLSTFHYAKSKTPSRAALLCIKQISESTIGEISKFPQYKGFAPIAQSSRLLAQYLEKVKALLASGTTVKRVRYQDILLHASDPYLLDEVDQ